MWGADNPQLDGTSDTLRCVGSRSSFQFYSKPRLSSSQLSRSAVIPDTFDLSGLLSFDPVRLNDRNLVGG